MKSIFNLFSQLFENPFNSPYAPIAHLDFVVERQTKSDLGYKYGNLDIGNIPEEVVDDADGSFDYFCESKAYRGLVQKTNSPAAVQEAFLMGYYSHYKKTEGASSDL